MKEINYYNFAGETAKKERKIIMAGELGEGFGGIGEDSEKDPVENNKVSDAGLEMGRQYFNKMQEPHIRRGEGAGGGEKLELPKDIKDKIRKIEQKQKANMLKQETPEQ